MNVRKQVIVSGGTIFAMLAAAALAYRHEPARLVVGWDIHGAPAVELDRGAALLVIPVVAITLTALFAIAPALMPTRSRLERSAAAWNAIWVSTLAVLFFAQILLVAANLGAPLDVPRLSTLGAAIVILIAGNWMGKVRYNYVFGLRTPWTLANERVWDKTHRFTGRLMVLAAIILVCAALALPRSAQSILPLCALLIACAGGSALAGIIYSAVVSRPFHNESNP